MLTNYSDKEQGADLKGWSFTSHSFNNSELELIHKLATNELPYKSPLVKRTFTLKIEWNTWVSRTHQSFGMKNITYNFFCVWRLVVARSKMNSFHWNIMPIFVLTHGNFVFYVAFVCVCVCVYVYVCYVLLPVFFSSFLPKSIWWRVLHYRPNLNLKKKKISRKNTC